MAGAVVEFTDASFQSDVLESDQPVLVDFWAPWCGPCRMLAPTVEAVAEEFKDQVKVGKLDTDQNQQTAIKYQIMSIPTLLLFKGGQIVDRLVGAQPKERIAEAIKKHTG